MAGDHYRYLAEIFKTTKPEYTKKGQEAYVKAKEMVTKYLPTTHPLRLGLMLNYSVYEHEIKQNKELACKVAKEAFDAAIRDLESVSIA
mmetsp:Transcript_29433/g.41039  ORF Transcript_29433/g.41039 Transcript_29433/m.41039 type:complete len:89 (+) Transcript_29433:583-849(+)